MSKSLSPRPAKRRTLFDVATMPTAGDAPVDEAPQVKGRAAVRSAASGRKKYPSATVYLSKRALRLIKEIALEEDRRMSDIIADAVDEYLTKRGHPSLSQLGDQ